jgi:hypothetical protein
MEMLTKFNLILLKIIFFLSDACSRLIQACLLMIIPSMFFVLPAYYQMSGREFDWWRNGWEMVVIECFLVASFMSLFLLFKRKIILAHAFLIFSVALSLFFPHPERILLLTSVSVVIFMPHTIVYLFLKIKKESEDYSESL